MIGFASVSTSRLASSAFAALLLVTSTASSALPLLPQSVPAEGLETFFDAGALFQDRNGDDVIDFVNAGIVVGAQRSDSDLAAAADVAARLGFETMAMNLPVARQAPADGVGIAIGRAGVSHGGLAVPGLAALEAGEGMITAVQENGRRWIVIAGSDDAGTRAAATAFAGRLPYVGKPAGATLADLTADLDEYLAGESIVADSIHVPTVRVRAGDDSAFSSVEVVVHLQAGADLARARDALRQAPARRADEDRSELLSYRAAQRLHVTLVADGTAAESVEIPRAELPTPTKAVPGRPGAGAKDDLDLSNLFDADGLLGDSDRNVIPDRIDAQLSATGEGTDRTIDLAARLGLESAGITVPLGRDPLGISRGADEPTLVVIGLDHPLTRQLVQDGKVDPDRLEALTAGEGLVEVVPDAFGDKRALLVTGGDAEGLDRALQQVAEHFPNLGERGQDRDTIDSVEETARRFLAQRTPGGQAAAALYKLDRLVDELRGKQIQSATVTVSLEKIEAGLEPLIREHLDDLGVAELTVNLDDRDVQNAAVILDEEVPIASEVDDFWKQFRAGVLPRIRSGQPVEVEARLSEPLEVRRKIADAARQELIRAGADEAATHVRVLSAFKQGFSWLEEVVVPEIKALQAAGGEDAVGSVRLNFAETGPPPEWPQQAMYSEIRWLKEAWPIGDVMTRSLGLDPDVIDFQMMPMGSPTYEVIVSGSGGEELLRQTFEPKYVLRPHYDRFPDYEKVRVTTGWIQARSGDEVLIDSRIVTDVERFWDHYQAQTLPALYDYVMQRHDGKPRAEDAPFFGELTVEVSLSEPDRMLGIDNEYISSMDSLHEEIYFPTLFFFRVLGRMARGQELNYIGRVIPIMHPRSDGKPGWAKIRCTGFATGRPAVVIDYTEMDGRSGHLRRDVLPVQVERPSALAATVRAGQPGLESLDLRVKVDFEQDDRDALLEQAEEYAVDSSVMTAPQATAMINLLGQMRERGLYRDELAFHDLGRIRLAVGWDWKIDRARQAVAILEPNGAPQPYPAVADLLAGAPEAPSPGQALVQWDTPIPPPEGNAILARMAEFPEATVYRVGRSYLGKDIWAMDLMPPIGASHWSHYKATTLKPTVIYSARQHANEVSSTSHVLKLAELLLTNDEFKAKLRDVNVIVHPFTNPDGAQLAYDLYRDNPDFILHAGYLGALGMDATSGADSDLPIYPEAKVRPRLWRLWLPDVFLNPHGYPSHEVVQLFSEYAGLVRRGRITERNWSVNRGWFIPGFSYIDDPDYPRHKAAAFEIRDYITRYINADDDVRAMNQRAYARYRRYGRDFERNTYRQQMIDGVNIQMPIRGSRAGGGPFGRGYNPRVTVWSGGTEAPDETAHGPWMKLVASAGLQWDKAILDYLYEGKHVVKRHGGEFWGGGLRLWIDRSRPPEGDKPSETEASHGH